MKRRPLQSFDHEIPFLTSKKFRGIIAAADPSRVIMRHLLLGISQKLAPMLVITW